MTISNRFNRFYHSRILADAFKKTNAFIFYELKDTRTNDYFCIIKDTDYYDVDDLKQLFKLLNMDYAVDEKKDGKVSTKDIDVKPLLAHIEYVLKVCADNDIELDLVREEWANMIQNYNR
jgi:hypothetical protein